MKRQVVAQKARRKNNNQKSKIMDYTKYYYYVIQGRSEFRGVLDFFPIFFL